MRRFLSPEEQENGVPILYHARLRGYGIKVKNSLANISISYCPWCGAKLPEPLHKKWWEILEGMLPDFDGFADPRIPDDFQSDKWWKDRKL